MNPRLKQRFISIDIANARHKGLVQQECFYAPVPPFQLELKSVPAITGREGLQAQAVQKAGFF